MPAFAGMTPIRMAYPGFAFTSISGTRRQSVEQRMKQFSEELNKNLDELAVPKDIKERSAILSKMFHIPKQQAWSLLEGHIFPEEPLLKEIAEEFDIDLSLFL
jgi:hypothetical protein